MGRPVSLVEADAEVEPMEQLPSVPNLEQEWVMAADSFSGISQRAMTGLDCMI